MQAIGLSLFSSTIANDSKVTKYLDKNLIIVSEAEMESIRKKAGLLFIPRCRIDNGSDILSEMKHFVEMCEHYNAPITKNIYGNLNKEGFSIISYNEHQGNYSDFSSSWQNKPQATTTIVWKSRLDNADRRGILSQTTNNKGAYSGKRTWKN
jgi:hypothetical protein